MTLPRKPQTIARIQGLVGEPIIVGGYTLENVPADEPAIIDELVEKHIRRIHDLARLAQWRRPKSDKESRVKERDGR